MWCVDCVPYTNNFIKNKSMSNCVFSFALALSVHSHTSEHNRFALLVSFSLRLPLPLPNIRFLKSSHNTIHEQISLICVFCHFNECARCTVEGKMRARDYAKYLKRRGGFVIDIGQSESSFLFRFKNKIIV